jgi:excisionase family DNA binding protein
VPDRIVVPLPDGRWLALSREVFAEALAVGAALMTPPAAATVPQAESEPLLNAVELSRVLNLPRTCIYEKARAGAIPSVRVGKHLRFRRSHVLAALGSVTVGRA